MAGADTFVLRVPGAEGNYNSQVTSTVSNIDFGQSFTSIQSLSIMWCGSVQYGKIYKIVNGGSVYDGPQLGAFVADSACGNVSSGYMYGNLNRTSILNHCTLSSLLDGKDILQISFNFSSYPGSGYSVTPAAVGNLSSVYLVLEATNVPEPSGPLAILCGMSGLYGVIRRSKRR